MRIIKNLAKSFLLRYRRFLRYRRYSRQYKRYLFLNGFDNVKAVGEDAYLAKWHALCSRVEPYSYRFFSHYCGNNPNIIPEDIGHSYIEDMLNPVEYRAVYEDKNLFPQIVGKENVPRTIVCRIHGSCLLNADYEKADKQLSYYMGDSESVILKPCVGTNSGRGILKFVKRDGVFVSVTDKTPLTKEFLMKYGRDFCLQEAVSQHPFMSKLCPTSVNTIRLALYRSVKDNRPIVTAAIVRIGKQGSFVDNIHAGGMRIGVNVQSGEMGKYVVDQYGHKENVWNEIDFSQNFFVVPCWDEIIHFAEYIGTRILHHRLIALDIALTQEGRPLMIEYNLSGFSYSPYLCTGQMPLGVYTDEVIAYCSNNAFDTALYGTIS